MIGSLLRLLALRPILGMAILGVPVLVLLAIGLLVVFAAKTVMALFIPALIIAMVVWLIRRSKRPTVA